MQINWQSHIFWSRLRSDLDGGLTPYLLSSLWTDFRNRFLVGTKYGIRDELMGND